MLAVILWVLISVHCAILGIIWVIISVTLVWQIVQYVQMVNNVNNAIMGTIGTRTLTPVFHALEIAVYVKA